MVGGTKVEESELELSQEEAPRAYRVLEPQTYSI